MVGSPRLRAVQNDCPFTCPDIDQVIKQVGKLGDMAENGDASLRTINDLRDAILGRLEDLRGVNATLRGYAEEYGEKLDNADDSIAELEHKVDELGQELEADSMKIDRLENDIFRLEQEKQSLESEIKSLEDIVDLAAA